LDGLNRLLKKLGIVPRDVSIYRRAFIHISVPQDQSQSYENLEFLGDAVLSMVVADYLVRQYPDERVGHLTRLRAYAVNQQTLSDIAKELGFDEFIEIERSKLRDKSGIEDSVLADSFESIVGAILLDRGIRAARRFALKFLKPVIADAVTSGELIDHKSSLQEYLQRKYRLIPRYRKVKATGPDHARVFTVECTFRGKVLSKGKGTSLKRAEQEAARKALAKLLKKRRKSK
jgi:ribonuclease-3